MPPKTLRERTQRPSADDTRANILAAALDLFSERSFEGASTRLIAQRAGVPQPLLTYHFGNKEELWRCAVGRLFEELERSLADRVAWLRGVDDETVARLVISEFVSFSSDHPQLHRIIMQECKSDGDRLAWLVDHHIRPIYEGAVALLEPLVRAGKVREIPTAHLYYLLTGAAATIFVLAPECRRLTGVDPSHPDEVKRHIDAVLSMVFLP
jgi:AcrR family transcriptional regulator